MKYHILILLITFYLVEVYGAGPVKLVKLATKLPVQKYIDDCIRNQKTSIWDRKFIYDIKNNSEEGTKLLRCIFKSANLMDGSIVQHKIAADIIKEIYNFPDEHTNYIVSKCKRFRGLTNDSTLGMINACIADHLIRYDF